MKRKPVIIKSILLIMAVILLSINCKKNNPPDIPTTPSGPSNGSINLSYSFTSLTSDRDGDSVAIRFDWGDNNISDWSSWVTVDDSVSFSHSWSDTGTYNVKAQAKDIKNITSEWSAEHEIVISAGWIKTYGGQSTDRSYSVQITSDGGYIITGYTYSFGAGRADVYLIKTDINGNQQWYKTFGGSDDENGYSIQVTSDCGYIIVGNKYTFGAGELDVYLIKTDNNGNEQWYKTFGGAIDDYGWSVQQTSDGGYIIVGYTETLGVGYSDDVYLIKTDENGNQQWYKTFGGTGRDEGRSVQLTSDGGYIIVGNTSSFGAGNSDVYLIKTDENGNQQWYKTFGGSDDEHGSSVQQSLDGGYIITGYTESFGAGSRNVYLIKTDGNGNQQWYKTYGGPDYDWGLSIQPTSDGGYIIAGYTYSFGAGKSDVYLIKTDENGNQQWYKTFGGISYDYGYSVQQTSDGGYIVAGSTELFVNDYADVYLIKTDENGNVK
jgi:hypothetical protein